MCSRPANALGQLANALGRLASPSFGACWNNMAIRFTPPLSSNTFKFLVASAAAVPLRRALRRGRRNRATGGVMVRLATTDTTSSLLLILLVPLILWGGDFLHLCRLFASLTLGMGLWPHPATACVSQSDRSARLGRCRASTLLSSCTRKLVYEHLTNSCCLRALD